MDIQETSKKLHEQAKERMTKETGEESAKRIKEALSKREKALEKIHEYQDEHGVPTQDEVDENFLNEEANLDIDLEEFRDKEDEVGEQA